MVKRKRGHSTFKRKRIKSSRKYSVKRRRTGTHKRGGVSKRSLKGKAAKKILGVNQRELTIVRGPHIFPMRMLTTGKFRFGFRLQNKTSLLPYGEFQFVLNSIKDPNKSASGGSVSDKPVIDISLPTAIYKHYRVHSAKIYFKARNQHVVTPGMLQTCILYTKGTGDDHDDDSGFVWNEDSYVTNKGNPKVRTQELGVGTNTAREFATYKKVVDLRRKCRVAKSTYNQVEAFSAAMTASPVNEVILHARVYNQNSVLGTSTVDCWIDGMIHYQVELYEPIEAVKMTDA